MPEASPPSKGPARRRAGLAVLALVAAATTWHAGSVSSQRRRAAEAHAVQAGEALYQGRVELPTRLSGHTVALPMTAGRCANCHDTADARPSFGPPLTGALLQTLRQRRGGPASRFDAPSLCRLLREGRDPADIVVPGAMPRYGLTDAQCEQLWSYLVSR